MTTQPHITDAPCRACGDTNWAGIEYHHSSPNHYDGVSEWRCESCTARFGRWTERQLTVDEQERPGGRT